MPLRVGIPYQPYSFLIKKLDSLIVAQDDKGRIRFSGKDAATVIQKAINALPTGGSIFISTGTYSIKTTISVEKGDVTIIGEGRSTTLLNETGGTCIRLGPATGAKQYRNMIIQRLRIELTSANEVGIHVRNAFRNHFQNITILADSYLSGTIGFLLDGAEAPCEGNMLLFCNTGNLHECMKATGTTAKANINWIIGGVYGGGGYDKPGSIGFNIDRGGSNWIVAVDVRNTETGIRVNHSHNQLIRPHFENVLNNIELEAGISDILIQEPLWGVVPGGNRIVDHGATSVSLKTLAEKQFQLVRGPGTSITGNASTTYTIMPAAENYWNRDSWGYGEISLPRVEWVTRWDPRTALGGIQLYNLTDGVSLGEVVPGAAGVRTTFEDVTSSFQAIAAGWKRIVLRTKGDGTTAPLIWYSYIRVIS